jgi:predicted enzyme related to lactoylglutathione lyase
VTLSEGSVRVRRIVANLAAENVERVAAFYRAVLDLDVLMDMGWIVTLGSGEQAAVQLSVMSEGGGGSAVPDLSIEVDDVDAVHARVVARGDEICRSLRDEPWGVRRFYVRDPGGRVVNILSHL